MIYTVSWFEDRTPQSVLFNSLSHARYFIQRLERSTSCRKIVLEENEAIAA